jgi:hypothetical protein
VQKQAKSRKIPQFKELNVNISQNMDFGEHLKSHCRMPKLTTLGSRKKGKCTCVLITIFPFVNMQFLRVDQREKSKTSEKCIFGGKGLSFKHTL